MMVAVLVLLAVGAISANAQSGVKRGADGASAVPADTDEYLGLAISVRTDGGASYQGILIGIEPDRIELLLSSGQIILVFRPEITEFRLIDQSQGDRSYFEDSASNRLIVMPTGFPMDQGEFHIAVQEIIAVTGSYGITDWASAWAGVSIPGAVFSLRASVTIGDSLGVSAGSFVGASWFDLSIGPMVLPYALVSYGEDDNNVTVGGGAMMMFDAGFHLPGAVLAIGGKRTLTATTAIVSENWIIWGDLGGNRWSAVPWLIAPALAFRIAGDRLSWDVGAVVPLFIIDEMDGTFHLQDPVFPIPTLTLTYRIQ